MSARIEDRFADDHGRRLRISRRQIRRLEGALVQRQKSVAESAFQHLDRRGVARIDLDRPGDAIALDRIDTEQTAQAERPRQRFADALPTLARRRIERQRADVAGVVEASRVQPGRADQLPGRAEQTAPSSPAE